MSIQVLFMKITDYMIQFLGDFAAWLVLNPVCMLIISLVIFAFLIAQVRRLMQW